MLFGSSRGLVLSRCLKPSAITEVIVPDQTSQVLNLKTISISSEEQLIVTSDSACKIHEFRLSKGVIKQSWTESFSAGLYAKAIDLKENMLAAGLSSSVIRLIDRETHKLSC
jgi:hypothetical protein